MPHNRGTRHKPRYVGVVSYEGHTKWVGTHSSLASYKQAEYERLTELRDEIDRAGTPLAHYIARFYQSFPGADIMWDELAAAAWLDPSLITKRETRYMSVDLDRSAGYGNTLTWTEKTRPSHTLQPVEIQVDLDKEKFDRMFVNLMSAATPTARN